MRFLVWMAVLAGLPGVIGTAAAASAELARCPDAPGARCGTIVVPAFRSDPSAGTMRISFRRYPALGGHTRHTLLAIEGGPGYPSTGSAAWYLAMLGPTRRTTALLVVDQRGTGASELIDCPPAAGLPVRAVRDGGADAVPAGRDALRRAPRQPQRCLRDGRGGR